MSESELRQEIEDLKDRVAALESKIQENPDSVSRSMDLSTFVQKFDPGNHPERAAAIAYYLEAYEGKNKFIVTDIRDGYEQCRFKPPANMSDVLGSCEDKGWMMRKGKDGQATVRQLTKSGIEMVEEVMNDGA